MGRNEEFSNQIKRAAIERQNGLCTFCGVSLQTPWSDGEYTGYAHHLKPISNGGKGMLENCVYLCYSHHLLPGHGMAPFDIDKQGGSANTWVQLSPEDFPYWNGE